jgi:hypothetical protein
MVASIPAACHEILNWRWTNRKDHSKSFNNQRTSEKGKLLLRHRNPSHCTKEKTSPPWQHSKWWKFRGVRASPTIPRVSQMCVPHQLEYLALYTPPKTTTYLIILLADYPPFTLQNPNYPANEGIVNKPILLTSKSRFSFWMFSQVACRLFNVT